MTSLYKKCPKCGAESAGLDTCAGCGLIFSKYLRAKFALPDPTARRAAEGDDEDSVFALAKAFVFGFALDLAGGGKSSSDAFAWGIAWATLGLGALLGPVATWRLQKMGSDQH